LLTRQHKEKNRNKWIRAVNRENTMTKLTSPIMRNTSKILTERGKQKRTYSRDGGPVRQPCERQRILHIAPMPPAIGGMVTYFQEFLNSGVSEKFEMHIVPSDLVNKLACKGFHRSVMNIVNGVVVVFAVLWQLIIFRPKIVHIQANSGPGFFEKSFISLLGRLLRRKVVMHMHGGGFGDFYRRASHFSKWLIRKCINLNHYIVAVSPQMRQILIEIGTSPGRVQLIRNAIVIPPETVWKQKDAVQISNALPSIVTVLFLNRISIAKGVIELIEAAKLVHKKFPSVFFRIVGVESADCEFIRKHIADAGEEKIQLFGPVFGQAKENEFMNADIYVLPSHLEDLPYGLMEAMSLGLPCIASDVGGIPSLIENERSGLLVKPKDVSTLHQALELLVSDEKLRRRIGLEARTRIEKLFNWSDRAGEITEFYNKVLGSYTTKTTEHNHAEN